MLYIFSLTDASTKTEFQTDLNSSPSIVHRPQTNHFQRGANTFLRLAVLARRPLFVPVFNARLMDGLIPIEKFRYNTCRRLVINSKRQSWRLLAQIAKGRKQGEPLKKMVDAGFFRCVSKTTLVTSNWNGGRASFKVVVWRAIRLTKLTTKQPAFVLLRI